MTRAEFSKVTKRGAWERSGGVCEASGRLYGLDPGQRCNMPLDRGVEYDHVTPDAQSHDSSLENCLCVCRKCHMFKTTKHDIPAISKTLRQQDKHRGITGPKRSWGKRSFARAERP